mmetsp:Transcript_67674/g.144825  ORF Transcript_67674/g.144825 Transcript_67674/m.144825 type:complete len:337 (+) Transcript_67674:47-1057(+)
MAIIPTDASRRLSRGGDPLHGGQSLPQGVAKTRRHSLQQRFLPSGVDLLALTDIDQHECVRVLSEHGARRSRMGSDVYVSLERNQRRSNLGGPFADRLEEHCLAKLVLVVWIVAIIQARQHICEVQAPHRMRQSTLLKLLDNNFLRLHVAVDALADSKTTAQAAIVPHHLVLILLLGVFFAIIGELLGREVCGALLLHILEIARAGGRPDPVRATHWAETVEVGIHHTAASALADGVHISHERSEQNVRQRHPSACAHLAPDLGLCGPGKRAAAPPWARGRPLAQLQHLSPSMQVQNLALAIFGRTPLCHEWSERDHVPVKSATPISRTRRGRRGE